MHQRFPRRVSLGVMGCEMMASLTWNPSAASELLHSSAGATLQAGRLLCWPAGTQHSCTTWEKALISSSGVWSCLAVTFNPPVKVNRLSTTASSVTDSVFLWWKKNISYEAFSFYWSISTFYGDSSRNAAATVAPVAVEGGWMECFSWETYERLQPLEPLLPLLPSSSLRLRSFT